MAALVVLASTFAAAAVPVALGFRPVVVSGGSMGASIPDGSLVMARWVPSSETGTGDVIVVQETGPDGSAAPKIHRIVSIEREGAKVLVRTRGDANSAADPELQILPDRVLTPAYHIPYAGFLLGFVRTRLGWLVVIGVPGTVLCLLALRSIWFPDKRVRGHTPWQPLMP